MKITGIIILVLFIKMQASAQWNIVRSFNWNNSGSRIFATSNDTCFITGDHGRIYRTINGGTSWDSAQTIFNTSWFNDVNFPSKSIGYACGATAFGMHQSIIARTTNGGQTWDSLTSNAFGYDFNQISMLNDTVGYFCGARLVRTSNGGLTFTDITPSIPNTVITAISFKDINYGIAAVRQYLGSSQYRCSISRTFNGGVNWSSTYLDSIAMSPDRGINNILFRNPSDVFAVLNTGILLRSADAGANWSKLIVSNDSFNLTGIAFSPTSGVGFIAANKHVGLNEYGRIYKTINGGLSWSQNLNVSDGIHSVSMASDQVVYASSNTHVYKTTTGGSGFNQQILHEEGLNVYPNPAANTFTLDLRTLHQKTELSIYDVKGLLVKQIKINDRKTIIEVNELADGLYYLRLHNGSALGISGKLMLMR